MLTFIYKLYCNICDQSVVANKQFQVIQYSSTAKHLSSLTKKEKMKQTFINEVFNNQNSAFSLDLCCALLASISHLKNLMILTFKMFFGKVY